MQRVSEARLIKCSIAMLFLVACGRRNIATVALPAESRLLMTPRDLQALPSQPADSRIQYGADSSQFGDLRVPIGAGLHPVVILIHGGCFKAAYATLRDLAPMADALKAQGIATWNVEYRRLGQPGSGWPGTYQDVGRAVDHVRSLAASYSLDLTRVVIVGHSAGGHLALWAAARARVPAASALFTANPLPVRGVVDLAGIADMTADVARYDALCGDPVIESMLGGTPAEVPSHYAEASAMALVPFRVPQVVIIGEHEEYFPRPEAEAYVLASSRSGDAARLIVVPRVGHFEIASPSATSWPRVAAAIAALLDGRLP
jgi:acetyl esterase/lipase